MWRADHRALPSIDRIANDTGNCNDTNPNPGIAARSHRLILVAQVMTRRLRSATPPGENAAGAVPAAGRVPGSRQFQNGRVLGIVRFSGLPTYLEPLEEGILGGEAADVAESIWPSAAWDRAVVSPASPRAGAGAASDAESEGTRSLRVLRRADRQLQDAEPLPLGSAPDLAALVEPPASGRTDQLAAVSSAAAPLSPAGPDCLGITVGSKSRDLTSRMLALGTSGSVGAEAGNRLGDPAFVAGFVCTLPRRAFLEGLDHDQNTWTESDFRTCLARVQLPAQLEIQPGSELVFEPISEPVLNSEHNCFSNHAHRSDNHSSNSFFHKMFDGIVFAEQDGSRQGDASNVRNPNQLQIVWFGLVSSLVSSAEVGCGRLLSALLARRTDFTSPWSF